MTDTRTQDERAGERLVDSRPSNLRPSRRNYPIDVAGDLAFYAALVSWQADELDRLTRREAELVKDAERYRKLRENATPAQGSAIFGHVSMIAIDAAVDALGELDEEAPIDCDDCRCHQHPGDVMCCERCGRR